MGRAAAPSRDPCTAHRTIAHVTHDHGLFLALTFVCCCHRRGGGGKGSSVGRRDRPQPSSSASSDVGASGGSKRQRVEDSATSTPSAMIPSYLRSRFGDKGSALKDQPSSRRRLEMMGEGDQPLMGLLPTSPTKPSQGKGGSAKTAGSSKPKGKGVGKTSNAGASRGGGAADVVEGGGDGRVERRSTPQPDITRGPLSPPSLTCATLQTAVGGILSLSLWTTTCCCSVAGSEGSPSKGPQRSPLPQNARTAASIT